MKNLYSCLLILFFFISCDDAEIITNDNENVTAVQEQASANRMGDIMPNNADNPFDAAGRIHNELFETYYETANKPSTILGIYSRVETIALTNFSFNTFKNLIYQPCSIESIEYTINHSSTCLSESIASSDLTAKAKLSLGNFVTGLISLFNKEQSCDVLYYFVTSYETEIINDTLLTEKDKRIILTTTSIARHSAYLAKKKPKKNTDPDWTVLIGNIVGGFNGAGYGIDEASVTALKTGIAQNPI